MQEAADGEEALACLKGVSDDGDDRFDLVICDVNLPRRSGGSLVSVLKAERPATAARVVLTTGDDIEGAAPGSLLQGYPNVLQKPFDFNTLRSIVDHMTGRIG